MGVADLQQHGLDAELLDALAVLVGHAQPLLVQGHRLVEVLDGNADVVDLAEHGTAL